MKYYLLYFQCKIEQIRSSNNVISVTIGNRRLQLIFFVEILANSGRLPDAFLHTAWSTILSLFAFQTSLTEDFKIQLLWLDELRVITYKTYVLLESNFSGIIFHAFLLRVDTLRSELFWWIPTVWSEVIFQKIYIFKVQNQTIENGGLGKPIWNAVR